MNSFSQPLITYKNTELGYGDGIKTSIDMQFYL